MAKCIYMSKFKAGFLGLALVGGLTGCLTRGTDYSKMYRLPELTSEVNFATLTTQVLEPKCNSCHREFETEGGLRDYVVPGDPYRSSLYTTIMDGSMPPSGPALTSASARVVEVYINGLVATPPVVVPSPEPAPTTEPTPTVVTYTLLKKTILDSKCLLCHEELETEEGMKEYIVPGNPEKSSLYTSTQDGSMPPKKAHLDGDEMKMIKDYINAKATE